jgi:hypothetical protein
MAIAIIVAVLVMLVAANAIADYVDQHPTIKMLALSFLLLHAAVGAANSTHGSGIKKGRSPGRSKRRNEPAFVGWASQGERRKTVPLYALSLYASSGLHQRDGGAAGRQEGWDG